MDIRQLTEAGKRIILTYPIPEPGFQVPGVLAIEALRGNDPGEVVMSRQDFERRNAWVSTLFEPLSKDPLVTPVFPEQVLCRGESCLVSMDSKPLYSDHHHLSPAGAAMVAKLFETAVAAIRGP
jgi:hypothetical protein